MKYIFSSPSFSFDAMLFYTDVELELIQDPEIYEFMEAGLRGGCSTIYHRLGTANTEELGHLYDPRCEGSTIKYLGVISNLLLFHVVVANPTYFKFYENIIQ